MVRAKTSYTAADFDDARASADEVLKLLPHDEEARILAARVALTRLDFAAAVKYAEGIQSSEAAGLRGRAHWYAGDIEQAADELESMLQDPGVKDPWAKDIARLARKGMGKKPFRMEGGVVAPVDMPPAGAALIVPCDLEGEHVFAMIATASAEVVVDSSSSTEPRWVSLRFGDRIDVTDVPALSQDLSGISRTINAPIKVLLGVNFLRHVHATFDRAGSQFVIRLDEPPAPPQASRVPLYYIRGGGLLMPAQVSTKEEGKGVFFVDSTRPFYIALDDKGFTRAGVDLATLQPAPGMPNAKVARLPAFRLGGIDLPGMPALSMGSLTDLAPSVDVTLGGVFGASLLEPFRFTFTDGGKFAWLEPDPTVPPEPGAPPPPNDPQPLPLTPTDTRDAGAGDAKTK
ncbi:hypothetical protein BH09MYX1_BH09MYX1_01190 [soil metagenome]